MGLPLVSTLINPISAPLDRISFSISPSGPWSQGPGSPPPAYPGKPRFKARKYPFLKHIDSNFNNFAWSNPEAEGMKEERASRDLGGEEISQS